MMNKVLAGYAIIWDDTWHRIEVNGRIMNLSPTQYRLCRAFLSISQPPISGTPGEICILSYQSYEDLQHTTELPSRSLLTKHVSRLNARLASANLHISSFRGGYIFTVGAPMFSRRCE